MYINKEIYTYPEARTPKPDPDSTWRCPGLDPVNPNNYTGYALVLPGPGQKKWAAAPGCSPV